MEKGCERVPAPLIHRNVTLSAKIEDRNIIRKATVLIRPKEVVMPLYEYLCETNGEVVEAVHGMSVRFETWGELCSHMSHPQGETPTDAPVKRLVGKGSWANSPKTIAKENATLPERTKWLSHGATVSPMRTNKF